MKRRYTRREIAVGICQGITLLYAAYGSYALPHSIAPLFGGEGFILDIICLAGHILVGVVFLNFLKSDKSSDEDDSQ